MEVLEYVAKRIRQLREGYDDGRGLSQQDLAKKLGIAANTVSRWETGTYKPSLSDLEKLARFFEVSMTAFFPDVPDAENDALQALLRAAKELAPADLKELQRYADYRRARDLHGRLGGGRPRKSAPRGK
jgi:transcriptional regulator with XRE-family HTH domain